MLNVTEIHAVYCRVVAGDPLYIRFTSRIDPSDAVRKVILVSEHDALPGCQLQPGQHVYGLSGGRSVGRTCVYGFSPVAGCHKQHRQGQVQNTFHLRVICC